MPARSQFRTIGTSVAVALAMWMSRHSTAHDLPTTPITFSREISRLLNSRCISCHRDGGSAFSLLTYRDARPWAAAIKEEVLERRMPPWGAVKGFGEFRDDRSLTQEQIDLIAEWVEGGAPEGDVALLPKRAEFQEESAASSAFTEIMVRDTINLKSPATLLGIRAANIPEGSSLMVTAERPDGSIEPLLWLYDYNPRFARNYWYTTALLLPSGTKIRVTPAQAGAVALLMKHGRPGTADASPERHVGSLGAR